MKRLFCLLFVVGSISANAQTIVDGSDKALTSNQRKAVIAGLGEELKDPLAAQVRKLRAAKGGDDTASVICGEVNGKNSFGAYNAFRPFLIIAFRDIPASVELKTHPEILRGMGC